MSSQAERIRGSNYSLEEKNALMILVNENKHIIENKKTNAVSNAEKEKTWCKVANSFNAISPAGIFRDQLSLKKTYLNLKMAVKKEVADEKIEVFKTGGGPSQSTSHPLREITLQAINHKTVFGLDSPFDSDKTGRNSQSEPIPESVAEPYIVDHAEEQTNAETCETIFIECEEAENDWSKWKSADLRKLPSTPLRLKTATDVNTPYSRRRPVAASALQSNDISKLYNQLAEKRLEVAEVELEVLRNKEKREQEKHDMEKKILEVQLQIKLEELKKLNPDWVSHFVNKNK